VESGVEAQGQGAVDVATSRGNSKGVTASSSQDPETNLLNSVEGAEVEAGNNMPNLIVELRAIIVTAQNMNNVKTALVSTWRSVRKSVNRYKTTFTSSSSPPHKGVGARRRGGNSVTHCEKFTCSKRPGEPPKEEEEERKQLPPEREANNRPKVINSPVVKARRATKDIARRPKSTDRPKAKPAKCDRQRRVLTIKAWC